jgi:hypothetical protein
VAKDYCFLIQRLITLLITNPNYKTELRFIEEMAVKYGFNLKTIHKIKGNKNVNKTK